MGSNDNELRLPQASPAGDKSQDHRRDRMKLLFISPPRVVSLWIHQVSYLIFCGLQSSGVASFICHSYASP